MTHIYHKMDVIVSSIAILYKYVHIFLTRSDIRIIVEHTVFKFLYHDNTHAIVDIIAMNFIF